MTGMEVVIEAPPLRRRPWGLMIDAAYEIQTEGDRWRAGVTFTPYGCSGLSQGSEVEFCGTAPGDDGEVAYEACPVFPSFHITASEKAPTLQFDSAFIEGRLDNRWKVMISSALARHAVGGATATPESFVASATVLDADTVTAVTALGLLEEHLESSLHGGEGLVWVAPGALPLLMPYLEFDGGVFRTPSGHRIVSEGGNAYSFTPAGFTNSSGEGWMYATGPIGYKVGKPRFSTVDAVEYLDRTRNEITGRRVAEAVIAFDPCAVGAAKIAYGTVAGS